MEQSIKSSLIRFFKFHIIGTFLAVQGLQLCVPNAGSTGLIPSQGAKIPHGAAKKKEFHIIIINL